MSQGYFITGTDTEVGKTRVAAGIIKSMAGQGRKVVGMKPVASGDVGQSADAEQLISASNVSVNYHEINPYLFEQAVSPHLAARLEGVEISLGRILRAYENLAKQADIVIVEGVGGWFAPLSDELTVQNLAQALNLPVILVVGMRLGCLNHALLTEQAIKNAGLEMAGWVANCIDPDMLYLEENITTLESRMEAPLLATVEHDGAISADIFM